MGFVSAYRVCRRRLERPLSAFRSEPQVPPTIMFGLWRAFTSSSLSRIDPLLRSDGAEMKGSETLLTGTMGESRRRIS